MYEKFLEDFEALTQKSQFNSGAVDFNILAEYIKKALILKSALEDFLQNPMKMRDMITFDDLIIGCQYLGLVPDITNPQGVQQLFNDIDITSSGKIRMDQLSEYIMKKAPKDANEMQEDILNEIIIQAKNNGIIIDNIFNQNDCSRKEIISVVTFSSIIQRNIVSIKEIDSIFLARKYMDINGYVNCPLFLLECKQKDMVQDQESNSLIYDVTEISPQIDQNKYQGFDQKLCYYMQKISNFMKRQNITTEKLFYQTDINMDGQVDKMEFINQFAYMQIPGIQLNDLGMIFEALDKNNDGRLSKIEFRMLFDDSTLKNQNISKDLEPEILRKLEKLTIKLFQKINQNNDNMINANEIIYAMKKMQQSINLLGVEIILAKADKNRDGRLDQNEFKEFLIHMFKEKLLNDKEAFKSFIALLVYANSRYEQTMPFR